MPPTTRPTPPRPPNATAIFRWVLPGLGEGVAGEGGVRARAVVAGGAPRDRDQGGRRLVEVREPLRAVLSHGPWAGLCDAHRELSASLEELARAAQILGALVGRDALRLGRLGTAGARRHEKDGSSEPGHRRALRHR